MGQSTEELRRDIEYTRSDMGATIDAIEDRLSPGRVAQRQKNRISNSVNSIRERVMGTAYDVEHRVSDLGDEGVGAVKRAPEAVVEKTQGAPLAAGAVAFGLGFLAAAIFPPTEPEKRAAASVMDTLEPAKQQLVDSAKEAAEHLKEPATQAAQEVKQAASDSASEVASTTREAVSETRQTAGSTQPMRGDGNN
jgi:ElaB/YqjD/DUF883 family membrane-anchored ribosome-binding protein